MALSSRDTLCGLLHELRSQMPLPTLSVITPSRNSAEFLEDALLSVARQQGPRVEHIVMDCASTDNTIEILNRFPQVQWISEPDQGQSDAINKGFLRATGDLMGWLNADDYYLPGGLEAIAARPTNTPRPMSSMATAYLSIAPERSSARRSSTTSIPPS